MVRVALSDRLARRDAPRRRGASRPPFRGLTLLELLLALSLSVLIIAAVGMAIDLQLRTLETRRTYLEEAQIARAVLRMIADDLRSAVVHEPQDFSAIEQMLASAAGDAAQELLGDEAGGGLDGGEGTGGGAPGGQDTGGQGADPRGDGSSGGDSAPPPSPDGGDPAADDPLLDEMEEPSLDIASSVTPPPKPGLYGNPFELQVDISRLPRMDELRYGSQTAYGAIGSLSGQMPSDVRTVAWYVQGATPAAGAAASPMPAANNLVLGEFGEASTGLVRRELGRSVTQWAINNGGQELMGVGELLASEVTALQFQYFDGYSWYPEWNSESMGGLPLAVEITLFMQPRDTPLDDSGTPILDPTLLDETPAGLVQGQLVYRLVVRLPAAQPASQPAGSTEGSDLEALGL